MTRVLIVAFICAFSTPVALQQTAPATQDTTKQESKQPLPDADFLMKIAESGFKEVDLSRAAVEKASDSDVKAFARRLVTDHSLANEEIVKLAKSKNVTLKVDPTSAMKSEKPGAMKGDHSAHSSSQHLMTLEGAAFDRAFVDHMVKSHQDSVDLFEAQADTKDETVEDWIEKKLPTLKEHLKMAKDLQEKISRQP